MLKYTRYILSALLVSSLIFSSVGYTAIRYACPNMSEKSGAECTQCRKSIPVKHHTKSCCKPKVEHKVIKTDYTNPSTAKSLFSFRYFIPLSIAVQCFFNCPSISSQKFSYQRKSYSAISTVEKCILLSTILI